MFRGTVLRRFSGWVGVAIGGLLLLVCLVVAMLTAQSGRAAGADQSPVAEYSFDADGGTAVEDLAGENDGTLEGATWARGHYGSALSFHGKEAECVTVPNSESLQLSEEFTLEAWVKAEGSLDGDPILFKEVEGEKGFSYAMGVGLSNSGEAQGFIEPLAPGEEVGVSGSQIEENVWTHIALTYDGNRLSVYVDGELSGSRSVGPLSLGSDAPLYIGCAPAPGYEEAFDGRIDEVRVYDRALGGAEVAADMEAPIQIPKQGPVAAYSLDEGEGATAQDAAGENDGTIEGPIWTKGRYGSGLEFDGEEDCVSVPNSGSLQLAEEFTLEAWVKPISPLHDDPIIYKESGSEYSYSMGIGFTQNGHLEGWAEDEEQEHVASAGSLEPGVWTHVVYTYDGGQMRLYVDGVRVADKVVGPEALASEGPLWIGCSPNTNEYFGGRIDEPRVYDRALNGAEVAADMEAPIQTPKQGPVAEYSFDEGVGTTVEDLSGDGHTATIEDGEWTRGKYGDGIEFDGVGGNECVSVADSPELRLSEEFTLEAWVRPAWGVYEDPVVVRESGGKDAFGLGLGDRESGKAEGFIGQGKGSRAAVGGEEIGGGGWTHVATTYDGAKIRVYVDGELVATESATTPPATGEGALKIGCDGPDGQFTGKIDEVRAYNRAITGAEVAADMEAPIQTPKATPVAAYSFDEEDEEIVSDTTGDGHTATVEGAKWTPHGRYGGAMEFDAAEEDVLKIPASPELDFGEEFTLEAWVRPSGEDNHSAPLIDKQEGGGLGYFLYEGGKVSDRPYGAASEEQEFVHAGEALPAHVWSHVALVFTGNRTYLYADGQLVDNGAAESTITSEGELEIGGSTDTADYFDGRIDEVRIYSRGLDAAEVASDMEAPIQTPKSSPVAAWSFEEGKGTTVTDITGDGHTGTIEGAEWARGKYGSALQFDGEGDVVKVADSSEFDLTEEFTLQAWVRPESASNEWAPILAKEMGGGGVAHELAWWLYEGDWESNLPDGGTGEESLARADEALPVDAWSHVALTYDGAQVRLYVNGELVDCSSAPAEVPQATAGELQIGGASEYGDYFKGRIDEARIYNRALNEAEIKAAMVPLPEVGTAEPYGVEDTEAVMAATVNPRGHETTYKFQYGPTKSYGTVAPEEPEEFFVGNEPLEVEEVAEELLPETTYHYRVVAHSDAGTIVGPDQTLTTGPEVSPEEEEGEEAEFHALAKKSWKGFFNLAWSGKSYETKDELNMVEKAGATTFRYPFGEPNAVSDKVFEEAAKNHIRILPDLGGNRMEAPNGKGERPGWLKGVREDLERYGNSGTFWTSHPGVPKLVPEYWEIWNEENYGKNGNSSGQVDPVQFADLLKETHELFEKTDASAKIMLGGLLTVSKEENGPAHLTVGSFLHELNKAGGSSYYQAVSLHPYAFKGDVQTISKQVMKNIKKGRHALNSIGGGSKKIWVTEIGWPVGHGDKLHIPVSEKKQKELLESVFSRIKEHAGSGPKGMGIEKAFYYNVQNNNYGEPKDWATYCGLREDVATVHPTPESTKPTPEHGKYRQAWYVFQEEAESEFAGKFP